MKTQNKILIVITIASVLIIVALGFFFMLERQQSQLFLNSYKQQRQDISSAVLKMQHEQLKGIVFDYSYWDEFIQYIDHQSNEWEVTNLYTIPQSFHFECIWVYNLKKDLIFHINETPTQTDTSLRIPNGIFHLLDKEHFVDFFLMTKSGPVEVSGATIHKTNDIERKSDFFGYFFVAKVWNGGVLSKLEDLTGGTIFFSDSIQLSDDKSGEYMVSSSIPLKDWQGHTLTYTNVKNIVPLIDEFKHTSNLSMIVYTLFGIGFMIVLFVTFFYWVRSPLIKISGSLETGDTGHITNLTRRNDEFGDIARMLDKFFYQKKRLEKEILDRIKTEKLLQENEEKFTKAFMLNPSAIAIVSLNTDVILSINSSFCSFTGYKQSDLPGRNLSKLDIIKQATWKEIQSEIKTNTLIIDKEIELLNKNKTSRHILFSGHKLILQEEPCMLVVMTDITERKEVEEKLKHAILIAEESDRLKTFLLENMSHEFRTPLTGILGFSEILKEDLVIASQIEMANNIIISAERLQLLSKISWIWLSYKVVAINQNQSQFTWLLLSGRSCRILKSNAKARD
jgi:PAS domain S-box-containing protein